MGSSPLHNVGVHDTSSLHQALGSWYAREARDLPWRRAPYIGDPYAVLVSEVMLQQTQVDRTIPKFLEFMAKFPTLPALARAPAADVIRVWSGMGYNRRAVSLHRLAQEVVKTRGGLLPSDLSELRALPGIGPYTAAAVACFAFGASEPVLDTNVYRVISRMVFGVSAPSRTEIEPIARDLVPGEESSIGPSTWHQGLMDVGATICTAARPRCMVCPLRERCAAAPYLQDGASRDLAEASVPYVVKQGKFQGSTRYYRGRIIEKLRTLADGQGISTDELGAAVMEPDPEREGIALDVLALDVLVNGLIRDGLARMIDGKVALP